MVTPLVVALAFIFLFIAFSDNNENYYYTLLGKYHREDALRGYEDMIRPDVATQCHPDVIGPSTVQYETRGYPYSGPSVTEVGGPNVTEVGGPNVTEVGGPSVTEVGGPNVMKVLRPSNEYQNNCTGDSDLQRRLTRLTKSPLSGVDERHRFCNVD